MLEANVSSLHSMDQVDEKDSVLLPAERVTYRGLVRAASRPFSTRDRPWGQYKYFKVVNPTKFFIDASCTILTTLHL
jgi:hypothetical protein